MLILDKEVIPKLRKPVGFYFHMKDKPEEKCIAFFTDDPTEVVVFYYDGVISVQKLRHFPNEEIKRFIYQGEKIGITITKEK